MQPIQRNPDGTPAPPAPQPTGPAGVSWLDRLRLSEPARLYLYGLGLVALVGLNTAGVLIGDWPEFGRWSLGIVLALVPVTEAVRASVYSTAGAIQLAMGLAERRRATEVAKAVDL